MCCFAVRQHIFTHYGEQPDRQALGKAQFCVVIGRNVIDCTLSNIMNVALVLGWIARFSSVRFARLNLKKWQAHMSFLKRLSNFLSGSAYENPNLLSEEGGYDYKDSSQNQYYKDDIDEKIRSLRYFSRKFYNSEAHNEELHNEDDESSEEFLRSWNLLKEIKSISEWELQTESLRALVKSYGAEKDFEALRLLDIDFDLLEKLRIHFYTFDKKFSSALLKSDYGIIIRDERFEVIRDFIRQMGYNVSEELEMLIAQHYYREKQLHDSSSFNPNEIPTDGVDFEKWIADGLRKFGWNAEITAASGDQGVDVIAEKNGMKVGIQCKLYSGSVGNKAVQEIIAAKHFYMFHHCAVVTNSSYTSSAKSLAQSANVKLLSHYDLPNFDKLFLV
jgi:restriction system protein